ncbi:MAG: hypothetical protein ABI812_10180, partial [Betaproteobacteria bacterium]
MVYCEQKSSDELVPATDTVADAVLPLPALFLGVTEKEVVVVMFVDWLDVVVAVVSVPPVQAKFVGAPPPAQLTESVVAPPPTGSVDGLAASEHPDGAFSGAPACQLTVTLDNGPRPARLPPSTVYVTGPAFACVSVQTDCVV